MAWSDYEIRFGKLERNSFGNAIKVFRSETSYTTIYLGEGSLSAVWDGKFVKVTLKNETRLYSDTSTYTKI